VTATTGGITGNTSTTPITTVPGAASQLLVVQSPTANPQSGVSFPTQPTIQLRDANGNSVSSANIGVTATITAGGGTLSGTTTVSTNGSGLATFTNLAISGSTGARTLTFSASGLSSVNAGPLTVSAGSAAQIAVNAGNG